MKNKTNTLKPTKKQLEIMKLYWAMLHQEEVHFQARVFEMERSLSNATGLEDLEFFKCDGDYVGIGNVERTIPLIQAKELEKK